MEHDIEEFGRALTDVDRRTGAYFSEVQGGVYNGCETNAAIDALMSAGAYGAGQSSWGPAVYGLVHERDAGRVETAVKRSLAEDGTGAQVVREPRPQYGSQSGSTEGGPMRAEPRSRSKPSRSRS